MNYTVKISWDDEARVWYVEESDVPGLCIEAATVDLMAERLKVIIPELLEESGVESADDVPFDLLAARHAVAHRHRV